jgi:hypothetical protein
MKSRHPLTSLHLKTVSQLLFIIFVFFSCQKSTIDITGIDPVSNIDPIPVTASVNGKVMDQNSIAVVDAIVKCGSHTTITDSRGFFSFKSITLDKYASMVTVEKSGYFTAVRSFSTKEKANSYVKLKLVPKQLIGTINAAAGGLVTLSNNSNINIPANSVVTKAGNVTFSGTINVYAAYIDPMNADFAQTIPGSLQAIDSTNKRVVLKSYGMMAVELESSTGQQLQIATGKKAKLRMTIPVALQGAAPATIPFWSISDATGLWQQEGNAVKNGSYYEGDVSHFSFWNCDDPEDAVFIEMTIRGPNGGPLPNTSVRITSATDNLQIYGNTDSAGYVAGFVPKGRALLLEVLNNCGQPVFTKNIGPYSQSTDLGIITITTSLQFSLTITGNVVDCSNQLLAHGSVELYYERQLYYAPVTNGLFSLQITRCPSTSTMEITTIDSIGLVQSNPYQFPIISGTLNTDTLIACGQSAYSTMTYTIDGVNYNLSTANGDTLTAYTGLSLGGNGTGFKGVYGHKMGQPTTYLDFEYNGPYSIGTFDMVNFDINNLSSYSLVTPFKVNITAWRNVGQYIEGNFNVQLLQNGNFRRVTCTFRIKRFD